MAIAEIDVTSVAEAVASVLEISAGIPNNHRLWFRGINNHNHKLLPGLLRHNKTATEIFEREERLITRFRQRSMAYWPEGYPQNSWEHLFAMQHFGFSTRLLDWSENLFVALYFALTNSNQVTLNDEEVRPVLWCMDPIKWNRTMPGLSEFGESIRILTTVDQELDSYRPDSNKRRSRSPVAMYGAHNSKRIVAQRGTFMIWGSDTNALETVAENHADSLLWKIKLNGVKLEYYNQLEAIGFSETMIFPELTSLAVELEKIEGWKQ